jgi:hypothetical protein
MPTVVIARQRVQAALEVESWRSSVTVCVFWVVA